MTDSISKIIDTLDCASSSPGDFYDGIAKRLRALAQSPEPVAWRWRSKTPNRAWSKWIDPPMPLYPPEKWEIEYAYTHAPPAPSETECRERFEATFGKRPCMEDKPYLTVDAEHRFQMLWDARLEGFRAALRPGAKVEGS